jgi:Family of unknown function (DUF5694)
MGRLTQWAVIEADIAVRRMSHDQKVRLADEIYAQQPNMLASILAEVKGIDVQAPPGGESYYLYSRVVALARKLGREGLLENANQPIATLSQSFEQAQSTSTVADILILGNAPETSRLLHQPMFEFLAVAGGDAQPGADLNARWYLRNAKIFANLLEISRPGDRVLVVYGFGRNYWLRHFIEGKSGFRLVESLPYLEQAQRAIRRTPP